MKKIITLFLVLCISVSLIACGAVEPPDLGNLVPTKAPQETTAATQNETTVPETTAPEQTTLEDILPRITGVWIINDTLKRESESYITFELVVFSETECVAGYYPGELFRPGQYNGFAVVGEKTYEVDLLYPAGTYMGVYYREEHDKITMVFLGNGRMQMKHEGGSFYTMTYGGDTFEEAAETAAEMIPYVEPTTVPTTQPTVEVTITPTTQVISEHSGYRIIREDRSAYNRDGQLLISQYYEYVELTAGTAAAQRINNTVKPDMSIFSAADELSHDAAYADPEYPFQHRYDAKVTYFTDRWLCVVTSMDWYWGGVHNAGNSAQVFDISTGEKVTLHAFAGGDPAAFEEQLKQIVWEQIQPQGPWEDAHETLYAYTLDTFDFALYDGQIILFFPVYEFFAGAHGPVTVETGIFVD